MTQTFKDWQKNWKDAITGFLFLMLGMIFVISGIFILDELFSKSLLFFIVGLIIFVPITILILLYGWFKFTTGMGGG